MNNERRLSGVRLVTLMYSVVWLVCVAFWLVFILIACLVKYTLWFFSTLYYL